MRLVVECDGGSRGNPGPAGYGAVVLADAGAGEEAVVAERAGYLGLATNNMAEYSGLLAGLRAAHAIDPTAQVLVRMDSQLVVEQMTGRWKIRKPELAELARLVENIYPPSQVTYEWVPRAQNSRADTLANEAMDTRQREIARDGDLLRDTTSNGGPGLELGIERPRTSGSIGPSGSSGSGSLGSAEMRTSDAVSALAEKPGQVELIPGTSAFRGLDPADSLTLVLVRHGVTTHTMGGLLAGGDTPGPPLSPSGEQMARAAAHALARLTDQWPELPAPSYLMASPMVRAQQTAAPIAEALGLPVVLDDRLREIEFGAWHELTLEQVEAGWPGQYFRLFSEGTFAPPGGESYADTARRVHPLLAELAKTHLGQTVVIVAHAALIRAVLGPTLDIPVARWSQIRIPPCSLSITRIWPAAFDGVGTSELVCLGVPTS